MKKSYNPDEINSLLAANGWAGILSESVVNSIRLYYFSPGEYLYSGGENAPYFYFYLDGKSKVYKLLENGQSMLVRFYQHFQIMGDVELFLESPAISSVQAITPVRCLGIPMELMKLEAQSNNALLNRLGRALAGKLEAFNITSAINQNYPLETRLASYLSVIYPEYETTAEIDELETENLEEMAEFLGCSYRHLTRTLKALKERGIIEKSRKGIRILNPSGLNELSRDLYV